MIQLYELLDYVWPNSVVLNLGEYENRHFIIKQQIDSKFTSRQGMVVYTYAVEHKHFPQHKICDIYADKGIIYIDLCCKKEPPEVERKRSNAVKPIIRRRENG